MPKMNFMLQFNAFWRWRETHELSHAQVDLYFSLLACANATGWKELLSLPNSTLIGKCQISESELHRQRDVLIEKGLIRYNKGKKGTAGIYVIVPLYETNHATNPQTDSAIHNHNIYKYKTKTKNNVSREASYDIEEIEKLLQMPVWGEEENTSNDTS